MTYFGTMATKGRAEGVVVATGMTTEVGVIAELLQSKDEPTPLQQRFNELSRYLVTVCIAVCACVVALGLSHGEPLYSMFLAGVSLAVAAIPEGLPAIVTIVLALGVQRIAKVKALVRRLPAVETLGSATVICSDKTGTLTCNQMTVTEVWAGGEGYRVTGYGLTPQGEFWLGAKRVEAQMVPDLCLALRSGAACTATRVLRGKQMAVLGDPTEAALIVAAEKAKLDATVSLVKEFPFDSQRMLMSVVVKDQSGKHQVFTKGAPDALFALCTEYREKGRSTKLTPAILATLRGLTFAGLVGMHDPPRPEVRATLKKCRMAGIRVIMVTGDHALTALAIAREIELVGKEARAVTGTELKAMSDDELADVVSRVNVFARVSPECKLRLVRTLRRLGDVVAMTGDGINDAPALKEADIGVSMGQCGTEVAREASALVLQDDNFATIVKAIEEGRGIYDNIRKFIRYLLSCNVGELLAVFVAMAVGLPLPLRPMQILWVNLVTDGLPAMALGVDSADKNVMLRQPRSPQEGVFSRGLARRILTRGGS
ncbi:MAG: Calcium-transporting ATPase [Firmicutes bacterium]|nr:Calcium-transporting ATPase [candidate division NPL-UPA2 bacterium]